MNRRSFIGTLTALLGVVLAKVKAPAAEWRRGIATLAPQQPITGLVETSKNLYVFRKNGRFTYTFTPDVGWQWIKDDTSFISPSDVTRAYPENFLDTCDNIL